MHSNTRRFRWGRLLRTHALGALGIVLVIGIWHFSVAAKILRIGSLPTPGETMVEVIGLFRGTGFISEIGSTLWASFLGFAMALVVGVVAGLTLGISSTFYQWTSTVVELLRPLPPIAFVPLFVLVFGQATTMKALIVFLGCIWPVLINTIYGVHDVNRIAIDTGRSFGWSTMTITRRIVWPATLPPIMASVKVTSAIALILCIGAEYIGGSPRGIGSWLLTMSLQPDGLVAVCAGVIVSGVLGVLISALVGYIDTRTTFWAKGVK